MVAFFVDECGARVESISPADAPREVTLTLGDASICVRLSERDEPVRLIVRDGAVTQPVMRTAPNGTQVEFRDDSRDVVVPEAVPSLSIVRAGDEFGIGRAGMGYRDLLPGRWGGAFIASHILIAEGGEVPDYVHFHRIRFQMIFCARGWVDLVYEDQGEPFRLVAGDCVLQPPEIRHRVLRSSPGLEVIEIGCPAVHDTLVEHVITLPTDHVDTRPIERLVQSLTYQGEFAFVVVLEGTAVLGVDGTTSAVGARDAVAFPPGATWSWSAWSDDFELLEVSLPAGRIRSVWVG
jgi:quercetin dioxygenase-like cupin family protein